MKKILLAFDGQHFSEGAFECARLLNEKEPIFLTGIFLPQVDIANLWSYAEGVSGSLFIPLVESRDAAVVEKNIDRFEKLCSKNNIKCKVHKDLFDFALPELKRETRFADLVILGSEQFYKNLGSGEPNEYLKDALHATECPILVVPEKFNFPKSNVLAYDGSGSSVYAIKQFAYLFPELTANRTLLVFAREDREQQLPEEKNIQELAACHFKDLTLMKLEPTSRKHFAAWLSEMKNTILISGSFGRSAFSQLFKKSFVSEVIKEHKMPVFITHR